MPAPLIEFTQFAHPQRWWLRRGPPPWLDDSRWRVRAFRVSLTLGLMGTLSGWLTMGGLLLAGALGSLLDGQARWFLEGTLGFVCGPGFWFGLGVLVPLSRWLGRGWSMSLLAVPASMFACYCGMMTFFLANPIMSRPPDWIPGGQDAAGFYAGFAGAAVVGVWMGHPRRKLAWLAGLAAALLAAVGCGLLSAINGGPPATSPPLRQFVDALHFGAPFFTFQSLAAVGLGVRLWWPDGSVRDGEKDSARG